MTSARMRGAVAAVAAVCAVTSVLAGCTPGGDRPRKPESPAAADPRPRERGPATLRFAVYGDAALVGSYTALAEAFMRRHPEVRVNVTSAPDATAALADLRAGFGEPSGPDVFLAPRDWLPTLLADNRVRPLDRLLERRGLDFGDGYQRDGLEAFSAESALQCMPHDISALVVYYNQRLVDPGRSVVDVGEDPPTARTGWSFEQFSLAARRASRDGTVGVHIDPELEMLAPFIWSEGGDLVDDSEAPTTLTMTDGDTRAALVRVLTLVRDSDVTPTGLQLSRQEAVSRFKQGRLAMMLGTRSLTPELRRAAGLDFEVFPLPSLGDFSTISSVTGYCLSADSEHVAWAADFIAFAVGRVGARITSRSSYVVPSNLAVVSSPAFSQPGRQPANAFLFSAEVRRSDELPLVRRWPLVARATSPLLERMFSAPVIDLDSLLARIDRRSQTILAPGVPPEEE